MSDDESMALPSAAKQGWGSHAHRVHPSRWDSAQRYNAVAASSAAASAAAESDDEAGATTQLIQKHNLMTAFFNNGKDMNAGRFDAHANNVYLSEHHFFAVAEASRPLIDMLERTGKYHCMSTGDLACFVHRHYSKDFHRVCHGVAGLKSKYAIFRIKWDGLVGGTDETVVAVFHINHAEAKKSPKRVMFMTEFTAKCAEHRVRIAMGDGNMACYSLEELFAEHKLNANLVAFHAEYFHERDKEYTSKKERELKWDSCGIWILGPILQIKLQGWRRHALAGSVWPQRRIYTDKLGYEGRSAMGYVAQSYVPKMPIAEEIDRGREWPSMDDEVFEKCKRWRNDIDKSLVLGESPQRYQAATPALMREYLDFRRLVPTVDRVVSPRGGGSDWQDGHWPLIQRSRETMSDWTKADPFGALWSKGGHFVLKVIVNYTATGRDRGTQGREHLRVKSKKKNIWMQTNIWPWWIESESEAHHWSAQTVNRDVQGGQCNGLFWRHSRHEWLTSGGPDAEAELEKYEWAWVKAHGHQAQRDALTDTQEAFEQSLGRGENLASLTAEADLKGADLAAKRRRTK